jgi:hypothetical protein
MKQFLNTYPKEMVIIGVAIHGGRSSYYIPNKGVAEVYYHMQSRKIYGIHMRQLRPYETAVAKELMKRKRAQREAVKKGKLTID